MKVYTKKGDLGKTSIIGEKNLSKDNIRIESYGTIDELNSFIGLLRSCDSKSFKKNKEELIFIQNTLFSIGASLATKNTKSNIVFDLDDIKSLENFIDQMDSHLPPLTSFILPGGDVWTGYAQVCRSICRRAERRIISLQHEIDVNHFIVPFINRLSDYFFVLARYISQINKTEEIKWVHQ